MTTIHIVLRDTVDGLVDTETTVTGWDESSNAQALANRINAFMAEIAQLQPTKSKEAPGLVLLN